MNEWVREQTKMLDLIRYPINKRLKSIQSITTKSLFGVPSVHNSKRFGWFVNQWHVLHSHSYQIWRFKKYYIDVMTIYAIILIFDFCKLKIYITIFTFSTLKAYLSFVFALHLLLLKVYIHNRPLQPFSQDYKHSFSHHLCVSVNFVHKWRDLQWILTGNCK